jgi:hypothetical protein
MLTVANCGESAQLQLEPRTVHGHRTREDALAARHANVRAAAVSLCKRMRPRCKAIMLDYGLTGAVRTFMRVALTIHTGIWPTRVICPYRIFPILRRVREAMPVTWGHDYVVHPATTKMVGHTVSNQLTRPFMNGMTQDRGRRPVKCNSVADRDAVVTTETSAL